MHTALRLVLAATALAAWWPAGGVEPGLRFRQSADGEFPFDTGVLRGTLRAGGKSKGLTDVVHVPSGQKVSGTHGLFGHYRVLAENVRFLPDAWSMASEATLESDGSVKVLWPAPAGRPFELQAIYRWAAPHILDMETRVLAQAPITGFESFLASYFTDRFNVSAVWAGAGKGSLVVAEEAEGPWQMFPRDRAAIRLIEDGRWKHAPNPVDWRIRANVARPIGIRRDRSSGLTAAVMTSAADCFAVATPHQGDTHWSLYMSLFGRDLKAGETASARVRMVIGKMDDAEVLSLHETFRKVKLP